MNAIPTTQKALNTTVQDLQNLGQAAKADLRNLSDEARDLAKSRVVDPSMQMVRDTKRVIEDQAHRTVDAAKVKVDHLRGYVEENPVRAIAASLAGGFILGLIARR